MLCILCVTTSERTLHIFQSEGISLRIREIIVKHFWLQPNAEDENTQVICMSCWKALDSFHKFYEQVEQAHIKLQSIKFSEINELKQENEPLHRISKDDSEEFVEIEPELLNADIKLEVQEGAVFTLPNIIRMDRSQSFESKLTSTSNSRDRMPLEKSSYIGNTTNNEIQTEISSSTAVWNSSRESFKSKSEEDVDVPTTESRKCNRVLRERRKLGPEDTDRKSTHRLRKSVTQKKVENSNLLPNNDEHAKIMDDDIVNVLKRKRSTSQESIDVQNSTSSTGENDRLVGFQNTTNESSTNFVTDPILADSGPECTEPNSDNDDDSDYNDCPSTEKKWRKAPKVGKRRGRPRNVNCNNQSEDKISSASDRSKKTSKIREYDEIITKNMKLMCTICIVEFANFAALKRHYRTTHNECGYVICCGKKFRKRGVLVDHIYTHQDPEYFKCVKCGRVLANRKGLDCHMLTHNAEKQRIYQCDQCTMSFYTKPLLTRHLQTHISERNIKCPECDKFFSTQDILRTHINNVHNDAYTRICDQCGKSFRRLDTFRRHQLEHDGVAQPLVTCEKCGVKLTSKYGLKRHMESMHPKTQVTHVCNTCGKIAPSAAALQRHISYMHKMERKYKCPMCDKAFKKTGGLKEHMSTHTGEVLYTCPHCPKTFNSNANMHSHRKKMHRKEWEENRRYPHMVAASQINRLEQAQ